MTIRRIELSGYWDDKGEVKIQLDETGDYVIMSVPDAMRISTGDTLSRAFLELRSALRESSHEHEWRQRR
jgi:hypothetical protein